MVHPSVLSVFGTITQYYLARPSIIDIIVRAYANAHVPVNACFILLILRGPTGHHEKLHRCGSVPKAGYASTLLVTARWCGWPQLWGSKLVSTLPSCREADQGDAPWEYLTPLRPVLNRRMTRGGIPAACLLISRQESNL